MWKIRLFMEIKTSSLSSYLIKPISLSFSISHCKILINKQPKPKPYCTHYPVFLNLNITMLFKGKAKKTKTTVFAKAHLSVEAENISYFTKIYSM